MLTDRLVFHLVADTMIIVTTMLNTVQYFAVCNHDIFYLFH